MSGHTASRIILVSPSAIFRAFVDPELVVKWRAPGDMTATLLAFDPRVGGGYRMRLMYRDASAATPKSTADSDIVEAEFLELSPGEAIVEAIRFEGDDPRFAGTMRLTTRFTAVTGGTKVSFVAEDVPSGISEADHRAGMEASLKNLAMLLE